MKYLNEDEKYKYYINYYEDIPVKFFFDKVTKEMLIDGNSVATLLGFKDFDEMIYSDERYINKFLDGLKDGRIITIRDSDEDN